MITDDLLYGFLDMIKELEDVIRENIPTETRVSKDKFSEIVTEILNKYEERLGNL